MGGGGGALSFTIFNQLMATYETDVITIPILQMRAKGTDLVIDWCIQSYGFSVIMCMDVSWT